MRGVDSSNHEESQLVSPLALVGGRVRHVEELCRKVIDSGNCTSPEWVATTVLNILRGNNDAQVCREVLARRQPLSERISRSHLRPLP